MNKEDLIEFEKDIEHLYSVGKIKAPIHLSGGNETQLIDIFKEIKKEDWIFLSYRNHYQSLLKGFEPKKLREKIICSQFISILL